ncbi:MULTISPECIES: malonyl-ACP O-methyltransferase BioC [unclassified Acinetobacter]|uniref:malonyl-ACP O-methyltransferase BioC n=1 Tax=unclassified Acinetobacter TaxID=196816 RepID=UPI0022AC6FB1|nr:MULTISPECIES: malonyl-ACP O-methyltransferase BioC [unclassified Acinetobacter]WAU74206.1 malonyl-ACP O-methyltransferase BioC [Acinetobacter sp. TR11]WAU77214.1 malonyl-ACP O-methyltransferase BioC [Acinetobacter sp. TR3]
MFVSINKALVAQRFAKAGQSYVEHAVVQKQISAQLFEYLKQYCPQSLPSVLEIGCGSGNLTHLFHTHFQFDQLFLNDLYEDVDQHFSNFKSPHLRSDTSHPFIKGRPKVDWLIGDIEQLKLPSGLDAVISSSALQWMTDLPALLQRIYDALKPKGYLGFSTFGENNLIEIKQLTGQGLNYYSSEVLKQKLEESGFEIVFIQEEQKHLYFDDPKLVLHHLKATGVTATSKSHRWTKQSLQQFYSDYQQFYDEQGFRLTYHPIYVIARRAA